MPIKYKSEYRSLEGIQKHPTFQTLTTSQQKWLVEYLRTGDKLAATHLAYPATTKPTTTTHRYDEERAAQNIGLPSMRELIACFHGNDVPPVPMKRKELVAAISEKLRNADNLSNDQFVKLTQYLVMLNCWHKQQSPSVQHAIRKPIRSVEKANVGVDDKAAEATTFNVDELVQQIELQLKD